MAIVYVHYTKENIPFYVGIGRDISRATCFRGRSKFWERVKNKHGIKVQILYNNLSWLKAVKKEINLISFYGRRDLGTGTLVNMTAGGEGVQGYVMSKKQKQHLREINTGKKHTEETKLKLSKSVEQYSKEGELLNTFVSMNEAQEVTGVGFRGISEVCRGNRKTSGGFIWKYKN